MAITQASRLFLERAGLRETRRMPTPRVAPLALPIHAAAAGQNPHPDFVFQGDPVPDRPETVDPWPYGNDV